MPMMDSEFTLEKAFVQPFDTWQKDPSPQNASVMLKHLEPAIGRGIRAHGGKNHSPLIKSHARKLTLGAMRTYTQGKSSLSTHVINHLQGLKRIRRNESHVLKTPERVMLDRARLAEAEGALEDQIGYEPSLSQLADFTGLSVKRIGYVRAFRSPMAQSQVEAQAGPGGETIGGSPAVIGASGSGSPLWAEVIYGDLTPYNQKIMEWTLGLHGKPKLANKDIAKRLRLSPGAISQRKSYIQGLLNQEEELSPF